jgi:hypothetical protein
MKMKTFKTLSAALAILALALLPGYAQAVEAPYYITVNATATNSTVTFGFKPCELVVANDGANEIFIAFDAAAVAAATTAPQIPAYRGKRIKFAEGRGPTTLGVICSAAETATVRVEAYQCDAGHVPDVEETLGAAAYVAAAVTADDVTTVDDVVVGDDLTVTGLATVGETLEVTGIATFTAAPVFSSATASRLVVTGAGKALASNAAITANVLAKGVAGGIVDSTVTDNGSTVSTTEPLVSTGAYISGLNYISVPDADTIADSGGAGEAAWALAPTASVVLATCNDADGCALTFTEVGATTGQIVHIINMSANAVSVADSAGVQETGGALSLGQYDAVSFVYATDRWVQLAAVEDN